MTKYLGTKFFEHDSTLFLLDTKNKKLFGISTERVTRIKHDANPVYKMKNELPFLFEDIDYLVNCFTLEHSEYHISKLKILFLKELVYDIYNPRYVKEFSEKIEKIKKNNFEKIYFFSNAIFKETFYNYLYSIAINKLTKNNKKLNDEKGKILLSKIMKKHFKGAKLEFADHHLSHAASSYYFSPYNKERSLVFTLDGKGVNLHSSLWIFEKNNYKLLGKSENHKRAKDQVPQTMSIGILYSIFTQLLGFRPLSDEGKTEALAAFGKKDKTLLNEIEELFKIDKENMSWKIDSKILKKFSNEYLQNKMNEIGRENFAATIQFFLEKTVIEYLDLAYDKYKIDTICMAGGVIANVILNLAIFEKCKFKNIYIFPGMGDEGAALGAVLIKAIENKEDISWINNESMPYWGPEISKESIENELKNEFWKDKISFKKINENEKIKLCANYIKENKIVALVQGKMEFGPRALGNRSILANPRSKEIKDKINATVKKRPSFQPFCPSVLEEERERLFEKSFNHKYMAIAFRMKKEFWNELPSAIHIDGTARPQFVEEMDNPIYHKILKRLKEINSYGIVLNTSFNLHGRTIVRTANDAITDFIDCNIDAMFLEDYLIERKNN